MHRALERSGRLFTDRDTRQAPLVMVVNEELARQAWPGEDPIGKRIVCCEGTPEDPVWETVVGVVADTRARGPGADVRPEFYLLIAQVPPEAWEWTERSMTIVAQTARDPAELAPAFRAAVRAVDPSLPLYSIAPLTESLRASVAQSRFNTLLLTALGLAGALAATRALRGSVRGITTTDPVTFAAVVVLMVAAALVAMVLPARRAARRVDAAEVLRES